MQDRVALVTGGTRGIGNAIATRLAAAGAVPIMTYLSDETSATSALTAIRRIGTRAEALQLDISDRAAVDDLVSGIFARHGRIDILVNNAFATTGTPKKTHEVDPDVWNRAISANLSGPFFVTRACLPAMLDAGYGRIVFVGSLAARGEPGRGSYAVAKHALEALAKTIALEYARSGITCNVVSPGYTNAGAFLKLDPTTIERAAKSVPMKRLADPEEIAEAVLYFTSPSAGYTTGQVLGVDGGAR